jgi:UV DNA damage endonuclease
VYTYSVIRLGCPAQNLTTPASTNRTLRLATPGDAHRVLALIWECFPGLETILRWNAKHGVTLSRIGQSLIPLASHPSLPYGSEAERGDELREIGELARSPNIRLSMYSGQFFQPGSVRPGESERSLAELHYVARVVDLISNPDSVIALHMGG